MKTKHIWAHHIILRHFKNILYFEHLHQPNNNRNTGSTSNVSVGVGACFCLTNGTTARVFKTLAMFSILVQIVDK